MADDALVITGATATGKTAVAVAVAARLGGEIISMDSRQVYRGMDIGTAKPTMEERQGVPHFGFDLVDPSERFNAGRFAGLARGWIDDIAARGAVPVLTGGTGFFLRALTHPMFEEPPLDPVRKEQWKRWLGDMSGSAIGRWAHALDADAAAQTRDRQRLSRIIEVAVLTGRPLSWWHAHAPPATPPLQSLVFVLELPRPLLYERIDRRVDAMAQAGLAAEVRGLVDAGYSEQDPGLNATGYIELLPWVRGERSLDEALALVRAATRRYARRQSTWLRHQLPRGARRLDAQQPTAQLADEIIRVWNEENA